MTFEDGAVLEDSKWQAPVYSFNNEEDHAATRRSHSLSLSLSLSDDRFQESSRISRIRYILRGLYLKALMLLFVLVPTFVCVDNVVYVHGAIALIFVVICLEIRVVFHLFGRYIQEPPTLSYFLLTVTMLGRAAAIGMISDAFSSLSAAGAIVVGFPILSVACFKCTGHQSASLLSVFLCNMLLKPFSVATPRSCGIHHL